MIDDALSPHRVTLNPHSNAHTHTQPQRHSLGDGERPCSWLAAIGADVICLQEVRAFPEQVPAEWQELGYHAEWYPAEKPGYSGVALLSKTRPKRVTRGMNSGFDNEGRVLQADFGDLSVISTYIPSGTSSPERLAIKLKFMDEFLLHCRRLRKSKRELIFCGDFNIAHQPIDLKTGAAIRRTAAFCPKNARG